MFRLPRFKARMALTLACFLLFSAPLFAKPSNAAVETQLAVLSPYKPQIQKRFDNHTVLISQILAALRQQQLPEALVLIPMLESSLNPNAVSPAGASGLWQLMPATATRFGLTVSDAQDQRFDIDTSTDAAIAYLSFLYKKFGQDLSLTLAAYNAGEGRVSRAIKRAASSQFPHLALPEETHQYVSRFYALSQLVDVAQFKTRNTPSFNLFANGAELKTTPLIDFDKLPPLVTL